ncbi:ribosomal protein S12 methylthiotransferase RimO [Naumannella cuiyingiana]|uniref:Ribosomal protein uS12 methylthiotransferase RimO n=1 Tax=Naumannella cuiyingiana TaxID=1347891 RepID=A0A7Z0DBU3_9ACTN|nr:ribosomal protein S12 methylthiotransferase RimO [Naumannella cuiyingiana]
MPEPTTVHLVSLGCARNEVDSEELAARLETGGFRLVDSADDAEAVMVNTCGFIEAAKKDSIDTIMAAADLKDAGSARAVVAVGCMAERYGNELAEALPEADAVLGFDDYGSIADRLRGILAGERHAPHVPRDRRTLLPITPIDRPAARGFTPGHGDRPDLPSGIAPSSGPRAAVRRRLTAGPMAPLKLASGCDRRCTFCAIPAFRGSYVSRPPDDVLAEARWLAEQGVREVFLVSENTSSYGKDLGDIRALENLLGRLAGVDGIERIRVSYLQPAETRPALVEAICGIDKVAPYFDLSFQHASGPVLRAMRRFGDAESFLGLIDSVRALAPEAGIRSNFIVGFPGESADDVAVLRDFLIAARLDAIGVFGYSDEEGTAAVDLPGHLDAEEIDARRGELVDLADALIEQRAEDRIGSRLSVLVEELGEDGPVGRAAHQGPEVDGQTALVRGSAEVGELVCCRVLASEGADLAAEVI